jgi:hypothetical protein
MSDDQDPHLAENLRRWQQSGDPRRWVEARRGLWGHEDWLALLDELRRSPFWPLAPDALGRALEDARTRWRNLRRWERSGRARDWVKARRGAWGHEDWLALLHDLAHSPFWPLDPEAVGEVLEEIKGEWANLRRWEESGAPREWLAGRGGRWAPEDWPALREALEWAGCWPADPEGAEAVLRGLASEGENLRRWLESGEARAWVAAREARWGDQDWQALLASLRQSVYWPVNTEAVSQALEVVKREWWNLRRWRASGLARRWVEEHWAEWGNGEREILLEELRRSGFWPVDPVALEGVLEEVRREWWNLRRWVLSGEPRRWAEARPDGWGPADWRALLDSLRQSEWWPMDPDAVRKLVDEFRPPPVPAAA